MLWQNDNDMSPHSVLTLCGTTGCVFLFSAGEETSTAGVVEVIYSHSFMRENSKIKAGIFHLGK